MKTREELDGLTKAQLIEVAGSLGKTMSMRNNRPALIKSILHLQAEQSTPQPQIEADSPGTATIVITRFNSSTAVPLIVNGRRFNLPINQPVTVPESVLPALRDAGVGFTRG